MENYKSSAYRITLENGHLHLHGFENAVKFVKVTDPRAKRLANLALHQSDLLFAEECLHTIDGLPVEGNIIREALWRSAVLHVMKCYGDSKARFALQPDQVLKSLDPKAKAIFKYFKSFSR